MDDLISRRAAIAALGEKPLAWIESEYEQGLQNQWEQDVDALMALPSVQRWIPVTEKLPEKGQIVVAVGEKGTWDVGMFTSLAFSNLDPSKWNWKKNTIKTVKWWMLKKDAMPETPKEE